MKNLLKNILSAISGFIFLVSCGKDNPSLPPNVEEKPVKEVNSQSASRISDLALIYHGGSGRIPYTPDQMKHYVFRDNGGKPEFLYDSFLFLEIYTTINGRLFDFASKTRVEKFPESRNGPGLSMRHSLKIEALMPMNLPMTAWYN